MSRSRRRSGKPGRRIPAALTGLALLAVAVLAGWAAVERLLTGRWPVFTARVFASLEAYAWRSAVGWVGGAVLAALGLVLILVAVLPGRGRSVAVASPTSPYVRDGGAALTSAGLARLAAARIREIDGVDRAQVSVAGRRLRARIRTPLSDTAALDAAVRSALTDQIGEVGIAKPPRIRVKTTHQVAS